LKNKFRNILERIAARGILISWVSLISTLVLTAAGWYSVKSSTNENAYQRFSLRTNEITVNIQKRMFAYRQVLLGGVGFFASSDSVTRNDWHTYIESLNVEENYPGILGIGFAIALSPQNTQKHIQMIRDEGFRNYKIWPSTNFDFITSIIYLEPFRGRNLRAFGYDMFSEPVRRVAMIEARDEAKTALSGKVILVQETNEDVQSGCLMYVPLYKKNMPIVTLEQKRRAICGFVYSPFRMNDLMDGILGYDVPGVHVMLFDGKTQSDSSILYKSHSAISRDYIEHKAMFSQEREIQIEGHNWTLRYVSLPSFEKSIDHSRASGILISGIVISLLLFITARSMASSWQSEKQLERLLESSGEGIYGLDLKGHCTFINSSALKMLKYTREECLDQDMHRLIHHSKEDGTELKIEDCAIMQSIFEGIDKKTEDEVFWCSDGTSFKVEYFANPIIHASEIRGVVVTFSDISRRKESEERIEASLREKDVLLKEIHHRVKNNLQIVASLINLQLQNLTDNNVIEILKESQNRIKSMALIHEKLYMAKNMSRINFANYINDLIRHLLRSYNSTSAGIKLNIEVDEIAVDIDKTISLGLAINEIVSNSLKHAFDIPGRDTEFIPEIHVAMNKENGNIVLVISDNGKGIPDSIDFLTTQSLGLQLVNALVKQLDGKILLERNRGTKFIITFPV
jgi:PAS domain S-box-containing protein